jgi:CRP-like cAMP-binding protein
MLRDGVREAAKAMAASPFLADVPVADVDAFADSGRIHVYRRGTYLCHQGDPAPDVFFLVAGRIEINTVGASGTRVLHATLDEPQFLGELAVLGDIPRTASALALADSTVWVVDSERFIEFLTRERAASRAVLRALARQIHANESFVDDLLFLDLKGRVAKRLLQFATPSLDRLPSDGTVLPAVTHADLASMCGGSRENVTRILSEFQRRGLVAKDGRQLTLTRVTNLARLAGLPG